MKDISISFVVTAKDEISYLRYLLPYLDKYCNKDLDELIILLDKTASREVREFTELFKSKHSTVKISEYALKNNFSEFRNYGNSLCSKDVIFQIDADEIPKEATFKMIRKQFRRNPDLEVIGLPRVNTVSGLTEQHVKNWGWHIRKLEDRELLKTEAFHLSDPKYKLIKDSDCIISEKEIEFGKIVVRYFQPVINWPDIQQRVYKNSTKIKWEGRVHEQLKGYRGYLNLSVYLDFALIHEKEIERQEKQNKLYDTL